MKTIKPGARVWLPLLDRVDAAGGDLAGLNAVGAGAAALRAVARYQDPTRPARSVAPAANQPAT